MKHWKMKLMAVVLVMIVSGCASLGAISSGNGRDAKLALPACPPDQVTLEFSWIGPKQGTLPDGRPISIFGITADDRLTLELWMDHWRRCALERGIVIEEANR